MSVDWATVLDEIERSILDGDEFEAPSGDVPIQYFDRLSSLMELCSSRITGVQAEIASTGEELSRLAASRRATQSRGERSRPGAFNQVL